MTTSVALCRPKARKSLFADENSDESESTCCSDSDDGKLVEQWANETVDKFRRRPEPHRSEAIRLMSHKLKVRDISRVTGNTGTALITSNTSFSCMPKANRAAFNGSFSIGGLYSNGLKSFVSGTAEAW